MDAVLSWVDTTWPVGPFLAVYVVGEALFWASFHFILLPWCNRLVGPQEYRGYGQDRHRLMMRLLQRMERTCQATDKPFLPALTSYLNEWFHRDDHNHSHSSPPSRNQMPLKGDVDQFFAWVFFGKDHSQLDAWMLSELQLMYETLLNRYGVSFSPGKTPGLRPMRLTLDPLEPSYRPLLIYLLFASLQIVANFFLMAVGFRFYRTQSGLRYWYRPQAASILGENVSVGRDDNDAQMPLLFFHGIAPGGVALYLPMILWGLGSEGRPLFLFENPSIAFFMSLQSPTEAETIHGVWEAVQTHADNGGRHTGGGVTVMGHSFGSCQVTWLLHSQQAHRIRQVVLVDPVSLLLSEPDVMTNFLYARKALEKRPKYNKIGVVANELFTEYYLRRNFAWYNSELWLEDIPHHCKVVICISENDEILNAAKVKREVDIYGDDLGGSMTRGVQSASKLEVIVWEGAGHAYCVSRPDAWKQMRLTMRHQECLILKEDHFCSE